MNIFKKANNQSGDTIIEVLIAVAVVSSVLVGAFLVTQRSSAAVRGSQEQSQILQILQAQVELVRTIAIAQGAGGTIYNSGTFCVDNSTPTAPTRVNFTGTYPADANNDSFSSSVYPSACLKKQSLYNIAVSYDGSRFTFTGRWDRIGGGKNQVQLYYRIKVSALTGQPNSVAVSPSSPSPAPLGNALFDYGETCGGANQPVCVIAPPGGQYFYNLYLTNKSNNQGLAVNSCSIDWGDGNQKSFTGSSPECQTGGLIGDHPYPNNSPSLPYPGDCYNKKPYTVILRMNLANNTSPIYTDTVYIPACAV